MNTVPHLSRYRREKLVRLGKQQRDPATLLRFLMAAQLSAGTSRNQVARNLNCAPSTVVATAAKFIAEGVAGLLDHRAGNGRKKVDDWFRRCLRNLLIGTPIDFGWMRPTWTRELLAAEMHRRKYPLLAVCTIGRELAALGARLGSPKPIVLCPWSEEQRDARLAELQRLVDSASVDEPVFYEDEVDIHLNPKIGRDWMLPGTQRKVITPGKNQKHYVAGALDVMTQRLLCVDGAKKKSSLFCALLRHLAIQYPNARRIHVVLDNYIIHKSKIVLRCMEELEGRIVLHFLPPYCPDFNRIERKWQDFHANVTRNHRHRTMAALLRAAFSYLDHRFQHPEANPSLRRAPPPSLMEVIGNQDR